ncbi:MAG: hypothetical protein AAF511_09365, partial [Pseudomonadota bacterium]
DKLGNVLVLDSNLNEIWRVDGGEPIAASVAVSPDNGEIYVVTRNDVIKLIDGGDSGRIAWRAKLDALGGYKNVGVEFNALTPTITANGVVVSIGGGRSIGGAQLMFRVGMGLLDRETGELRYFALGREESISVSSVAPDGGFYTANSPIRRVSAKALFPKQTDDIIGGISRYRPIRLDLMARDAICAASARAANAASLGADHIASVEQDVLQVQVLINQARAASDRAVDDGDMSPTHSTTISVLLDQAEGDLTADTLNLAQGHLAAACQVF